jgi:hypothetical protein
LLARATHLFSELIPLKFLLRIFHILLRSMGNYDDVLHLHGDNWCTMFDESVS